MKMSYPQRPLLDLWTAMNMNSKSDGKFPGGK